MTQGNIHEAKTQLSSLVDLPDRNLLRPLIAQDPQANSRVHSILFGRALPWVRILADDPVAPRGALVSADGRLWELVAADPEAARTVLTRFEPDPAGAVLVNLPASLVPHATRCFEVQTETPLALYVLHSPEDFRPAPGDLPTGTLGPEHIEVVCATWPPNDFPNPEAKLAYVRGCIEAGPSSALFEDDRPVAFALTHGEGSVGMVYTAPDRRRLGLARRVVSAVVGRLLERGAPVFCFVVVGNTPSKLLFEGLGLRPTTTGVWLKVARRLPGQP